MNKQERAALRKTYGTGANLIPSLLNALDEKDALIEELLQLSEDAIASRVDINTAYTVFDLLKARASQ